MLWVINQPNLPWQPAMEPGQPGQHAAKEAVIVYFSKSQGNETVTEGVVRPYPGKHTHDEALNLALQQLLKGPSDAESVQGYFSEIPKGTRLIGITRHGDGQGPGQRQGIRVNLSHQFKSGGGAHSMRQRLQELKRTIADVALPEPVYIDIEGVQLDLLGGEGLEVHEPINRDPVATP